MVPAVFGPKRVFFAVDGDGDDIDDEAVDEVDNEEDAGAASTIVAEEVEGVNAAVDDDDLASTKCVVTEIPVREHGGDLG